MIVFMLGSSIEVNQSIPNLGAEDDWKVIFSIFTSPKKALVPIDWIVAGKVILLDNEQQFLKAESPIVSILSFILIAFKLLQPIKALFPIAIVSCGILICVKLVQSLKAFASIFVIVLGNLIFSILLHPLKIPFPIVLIESLKISTLFNPLQLTKVLAPDKSNPFAP